MSEHAPNRIMAAPTGHFHTPEGDFVSWGDDDAAVEYVRADLAKPRVKPLEWNTGIVHWATPLPGMKYVACPNGPGRPCSWWLDGAEAETRQVRPSEEAAKAAAQADYERRVLSALILPGGAGHS
jgi:hypothetical protein